MSAPTVEPIWARVGVSILSLHALLKRRINAAASELPPPRPAPVGMFFSTTTLWYLKKSVSVSMARKAW